MANVTIGQLTLASSAAAGDFIEMETVAGLSRKIAKSNFIGGTLTGGPTISGAGTLALGANTLTISSGGTLALGGFTLTVPATGTAALKSGTPTAARIASWLDANSVQDGGIAVSDLGRLSLAQTFSALKTFSAGLSFGNETLNVYLESTWIPQLYGSVSTGAISYGTRTGKYTRIGNVIFFHAFIAVTTITGGSGDLRLSLPTTVGMGPFCVAYLNNVDLPGTPVSIFFAPEAGAAHGAFNIMQDNAGSLVVPITNVANGDYVSASGFYFA